MAKKKENSKVDVISRVVVTLSYSDGQGFSKPEEYRGYYLGRSDTQDMFSSNYQRILPDLKERTPENDEKALMELRQIANAVEDSQARLFKRHFPNIKR